MAQVPELEEIRGQIEEVRVRARALLEDVSQAQLWERPPEGGWSVAECFAHLTTTGYLYAERLGVAIEEARAKGVTGTGPFRYGFLGGRFVKMQEPPARFRSKTPKLFVPLAQPGEDVVTPFFALQDELITLTERADGLDLARVTIISPVTKLLRLSILEAFGVTLAHERRHLWQAERVLETLEKR